MYRREFLKKSIAGSVGLAVGAGALLNSSCKGANDKIVLALIGCGSRGTGSAINCCKSNENVTIKTVCDVNSTKLANAAAAVEKDLGYRPATCGNMKEIMNDKDVNAVWIATPEHWLALATVWACQAGKHVYVEKNASLNIWESRKMVEAARKYKRIVQVGFQNRSAAYGLTARDYIAEGKLGKVIAVKCYNMTGGSGWTEQPETPVPSWLDWEQWQGPAVARPFTPSIVSEKERGDWSCYWAYSGGALSGGAAHVLDFARLALGDPPHPRSVYGWGGNHVFEGTRETPEFQHLLFDFGDFTLTCESGQATDYMIKIPADIRTDKTRFPNWSNNATRAEIYGSEGFMYLGTYGGGWQVVGTENEIIAQDGGISSDKEHQTDFIQSIRTRKKPNGDIETCHHSATLVHLGNIAYRAGNTQLFFDDKAEKFLNNDQANTFLKCSYRDGYAIPEKI